MLKFVILFVAPFLSVSALAKPQSHCLSSVIIQLRSQGIESVDQIRSIELKEANDTAISEGYLTGRDLRSALLKFEKADFLFLVLTSAQGGSATDVLTVQNGSCKIQNMIRIQED